MTHDYRTTAALPGEPLMVQAETRVWCVWYHNSQSCVVRYSSPHTRVPARFLCCCVHTGIIVDASSHPHDARR
jgi:hypothetical protein